MELYDKILNKIELKYGEAGKNFTCGKFEGLGWDFYHYKCSTYDGPYPRVALKQQKNGTHVYTMLWEDGKSVLEDYIDVFGKSAVGKGCLRIKKLTPEREAALDAILDVALLKKEA